MIGRTIGRRPVALALACGAAGWLVACAAAPPVVTPGPAWGPARAVWIVGPEGGGRRQWALAGEVLLLPGPAGFPYQFRGEPVLRYLRAGRLLVVNDRTVGVDLTDLVPADAIALLSRHGQAIRTVVWRGVDALPDDVLRQVAQVGHREITLLLGSSLATGRPLPLGRLLVLQPVLRGLVLEPLFRPRDLERLAWLPALQSLTIAAALEPSALAAIGRIRHLRGLALAGALKPFGTGEAGLGPLGALRSLNLLDVGRNRLAPGALGRLSRFADLRRLDLSESALGRRELADLRRLRRLEALSLEATPVDGAGLSRIAGHRTLRALDLTETRVSTRGIEALRRALPGCEIVPLTVPEARAQGVVIGSAEPEPGEGSAEARLVGPGGACARFVTVARCLEPILRVEEVRMLRLHRRLLQQLAGRWRPGEGDRTCQRILGYWNTRLARPQDPRAARCLRP